MGRRSAFIPVVLALVWLAMPARSSAQSTIAGVVKDTSGGVLPGVTVEAGSPALIEKTRTVVSDSSGEYKIIDLRPGTYTVTFTLVGFNAVKREGVELPPNFTASVNAEMVVGALEETITVSGAAPVVDVQNATTTQVLTSELLSALPSARNFQSLGLALPALKAGAFDVGGSTQQQQGVVVTAGSIGTDQIIEVDGMNVMSTTGGAGQVVYHNVGGYQEQVYQSFGSTAEMQSGGVIMNMIPKTGGNQVTFEGVSLFANTSMEQSNLDAALMAKGYVFPGKLQKTFDENGSLGFPLIKNKLWWFTSVRYWTYNNYVANWFFPDGSQAVNDNINHAYTNRATWQISSNNKITALYDKLPRTRYESGIETGTLSPEASTHVNYDLGYIAQAKYTSTITSKLLFEAGFSSSYYRAQSGYENPSQYPSASNPFGAISQLNTTTGFTTVGPATLSHPLQYNKPNYMATLSYVTGSHAFKAGVQYAYDRHRTFTSSNGADVQQLYHNVAGVGTNIPYAVNVYNTPTFAEADTKHDVDLFVQDAWTLRRLTITPGFRYENLDEGWPTQVAPASPFVPARVVPAVNCLPCFSNRVGRLGAAYDVFGDGKTAIKGSAGKYTVADSTSEIDLYDPMNVATDQRTWTDANHDNIAQPSDIGPSQNANFGIETRFPSPGLKRPTENLYTIGIQHQISRGTSATVTYYHRDYLNIIATENTRIPNGPGDFAAEYTTVQIPNPLYGTPSGGANGPTITVYNLRPQYVGLVHEVDYNSPTNKRFYNGIDVSVSARLPGQIVLNGGTTTGKFHRITCDVENPNSLANCNAPEPFTTAVKVSGIVPLKYGVRVSLNMQSMPGLPFSRDSLLDGDIIESYVITRALVPQLTTASVTQRLNASGVDFYPRVEQLDISLSKRIRTSLAGHTEIIPQLDIFNALNVNPITSETQVYGPAYGFPLTVLPPRLFRLGVQVRW